ncbi:hypothetical protein H8356DRAFT_1371549 [Neocallimastix lanati (nom. inval.)]|nr:hypothetical protein H8356DRAFT_1371549 [Neocallimastix sp. JGI-2020a]
MNNVGSSTDSDRIDEVYNISININSNRNTIINNSRISDSENRNIKNSDCENNNADIIDLNYKKEWNNGAICGSLYTEIVPGARTNNQGLNQEIMAFSFSGIGPASFIHKNPWFLWNMMVRISVTELGERGYSTKLVAFRQATFLLVHLAKCNSVIWKLRTGEALGEVVTRNIFSNNMHIRGPILKHSVKSPNRDNSRRETPEIRCTHMICTVFPGPLRVDGKGIAYIRSSSKKREILEYKRTLKK